MTSSDSSLGTLLRRLIEALDGDVEAGYRAAGLDFRPRFAPVFRPLVACGPLRIKDIAARAGITHSAVSQTVAQMSAAGWVALQAGPDARERIVRLTPKAEAALPAIEAHWTAVAGAAASLDEEIDLDLEAVLTTALTALERRSFRARMGVHAKVGG